MTALTGDCKPGNREKKYYRSAMWSKWVRSCGRRSLTFPWNSPQLSTTGSRVDDEISLDGRKVRICFFKNYGGLEDREGVAEGEGGSWGSVLSSVVVGERGAEDIVVEFVVGGARGERLGLRIILYRWGEESGVLGQLGGVVGRVSESCLSSAGGGTLRGQGGVRKVFCSLGRGSFNVKEGARGGCQAVGGVESNGVKELYRALRVVGTLGEQGDVGRVPQSREIKILFGGLDG